MKHLTLASSLFLGLLAAQPALAQSAAGAPTFAKDVAPILYQHCTVCHRPGEVAPMSLLTYQSARPYARAIAARVSNGTMPPWHADPAHGEFANDRRLSAAEKDTILKWVSGGTPEGDAADLPAAPTYPDGWSVGAPDAVFAMQESYPVKASGTIDYKYFEVPTNFTEDKWIQAFEVKAGTPSVVHHVIVYARAPRRERPAGAPAQPQQRREGPITMAPNMDIPDDVKANEARQDEGNDRPAPEGGLGSFVGGFVPGFGSRVFPDGMPVRLPAGSTLVFQMHYTANGKPAEDRTRIGFVFAKEKPKNETIMAALLNQNFTLPAGAADTRVDAEMTINQPLTLYSLTPHTHVRGKRWQVEARYPDGRSEILLAVPNYDFNWQTEYIFKTPLKLPKGSVLHTSAWYDNSAGNKSNPDPSATVHWGEQTWEEMQFTAFTFSLDPQPRPSSAGQQ
jgi:mono/diheme cytochrome c family protein